MGQVRNPRMAGKPSGCLKTYNPHISLQPVAQETRIAPPPALQTTREMMPDIELPHYARKPQHLVHQFLVASRIERYKRMDEIAVAYQAGLNRSLRGIRDKYAKSPSVRIACLYEAGMRMPSMRNGMQRPSSLISISRSTT
jgi:hypothetical protein